MQKVENHLRNWRGIVRYTSLSMKKIVEPTKQGEK